MLLISHLILVALFGFSFGSQTLSLKLTVGSLVLLPLLLVMLDTILAGPPLLVLPFYCSFLFIRLISGYRGINRDIKQSLIAGLNIESLGIGIYDGCSTMSTSRE